MHGLMIDYNLMTKCLEETKQAAASAEEHASAVQQECIVLRQEKDVLHEELQDIKQQLNKKDSELEECNIKLRWAQEAPRYSPRGLVSWDSALNTASISLCITTCHTACAPSRLVARCCTKY